MRVYNYLLLLYPAGYRNEYGDELRSVFQQRRSQATGLMSVAALWIAEICDVLWNALLVFAFVDLCAFVVAA